MTLAQDWEAKLANADEDEREDIDKAMIEVMGGLALTEDRHAFRTFDDGSLLSDEYEGTFVNEEELLDAISEGNQDPADYRPAHRFIVVGKVERDPEEGDGVAEIDTLYLTGMKRDGEPFMVRESDAINRKAEYVYDPTNCSLVRYTRELAALVGKVVEVEVQLEAFRDDHGDHNVRFTILGSPQLVKVIG